MVIVSSSVDSVRLLWCEFMNQKLWEDRQLVEALEYLDRVQDLKDKILDDIDLMDSEIVACQATIDLIIETLNDRSNYET